MRFISPYKCVHEKLKQLSTQTDLVACMCLPLKNMQTENLKSSKSHCQNLHCVSGNMPEPKADNASFRILAVPEPEGTLHKTHAATKGASEKSGKKRPDKPLYVPRARRCANDISSTKMMQKTKPAVLKSAKSANKLLSESALYKTAHTNIMQSTVPDDSCSKFYSVKDRSDVKILSQQQIKSVKIFHDSISQTPQELQPVDCSISTLQPCTDFISVHEDPDVSCKDAVHETWSDLKTNSDKYLGSEELEAEMKTKSSEGRETAETSLAAQEIKKKTPVFSGTQTNDAVACENRVDCYGQTSINKNSLGSLVYGSNTEGSYSEPVNQLSNLYHSELNKTQLQQKSTEVDSWDTLFDDDGECLCPEIIRELTSVIGHLEAKRAESSYLEFKREDENYDDFVIKSSNYDSENTDRYHAVELYDFPVEFKTQDLVSALSCFRPEDYVIRWVDDCHAIAIFSSSSCAVQAVEVDHPFVKIRPISQGTKESKSKAKFCARSMEPPKPRPATSAALARRLVSGALGLKVVIPKEEREREKKIISDAKEQKKKAAKRRENIWDGIVM